MLSERKCGCVFNHNGNYTRDVHKVRFPFASKPFVAWRGCVYVIVVTSHDAFSTGTSRVFRVASVQRLKVEALIPAPTNCEMHSVMKFLNAQSTATDTRTQSKAHGVSIDISAAVPWWRRWVSGPDHHRWWNVGGTHYPKTQAAVNALSQSIFLQDEIQTDIVGAESDAHRLRLVSIPGRRLLRHRDASWSHRITNVSFPKVNTLEITQHSLYLFQ